MVTVKKTVNGGPNFAETEEFRMEDFDAAWSLAKALAEEARTYGTLSGLRVTKSAIELSATIE